MATRSATETLNPAMIITANPKPMRVCFSFAAYAKNVIDHLKTTNTPVTEGLSDLEFSSIESSLGFTFPPDLRSILREGLPVGPGFPNWRSSSPQQLHILTNLPILGICKEVSRANFWLDSWGAEPHDPEVALALAKQLLKKTPVLVPIYRHCYIPSVPNLAGNPVFFVQGVDVRLSSFDVAGFFQQNEFRGDGVFQPASLPRSPAVNAPAWAATAARRIEFWSDLVERVKERDGRRGWASGAMQGCLEEMFWRLRDGGWREEEVREMMMMDGDDEPEKRRLVLRDKKGVVWQVGLLSRTLLRAGWSTEDVVYSLGSHFENGPPEAGLSISEQLFSVNLKMIDSVEPTL